MKDSIQKRISLIVITLLLSAFCSLFAGDVRHRLIVLADMGNEPDEEQQMTHMMVCSNEFDIEALIAVTGKYIRPEISDPYRQITHPELFHKIIDAYEKVLPNLKKHADGWQNPDDLRKIVAAGQKGLWYSGCRKREVQPGIRTYYQGCIERRSPSDLGGCQCGIQYPGSSVVGL